MVGRLLAVPLAVLWAVVISLPSLAQVVAPHAPLRILIVSDEVNPHGLPPADLTQPGEISTALLALGGLQLVGPDPVLEIPTDSLELATAWLELPPGDPLAYDVLIYFAHRIPNGADAAQRQADFVAAVDQFLIDGGSVLSFHHGIYRTAGKEAMQALLGAEATGAVPWNTVEGQNVIAVAPQHFVAAYGVDYGDSVLYEDPASGIPLANYPMFNNTPDERYPTLDLLPSGGLIEPLFASDYDSGTHLLGYVQRRPEWDGAVLMYQPGEHEPHALGPGPNFQILINAVLFAATGGDLLFADGFESGDSGNW